MLRELPPLNNYRKVLPNLQSNREIAPKGIRPEKKTWYHCKFVSLGFLIGKCWYKIERQAYDKRQNAKKVTFASKFTIQHSNSLSLREMRKGYLFETLTRLIREALNDQTGLEIGQNVKLIDLSGDKREFDVVIESKVNEFTARIIFECKDTRSRVKAEKMEAFKAKIGSLPGANQAVYVSKSGFQKKAQTIAKESGIQLVSMRVVDKENVSGMLTVLQIKIRQLDFKLYRTWFYSDGEKYDAIELNLRLQADGNRQSSFDVTKFFTGRMFQRLMEMFPNLPDFVEREIDAQGKDIDTSIRITKIGPGCYFIHNQKRYNCSEVEFEIKHDRLIVPVDSTQEWEYKKWDAASPDARAFEYDPLGLGLKIVVVNTGKENHQMFLLDREWKEICPNLPGLFCQKEFTIRLPSSLKIEKKGRQ
jgi:hypothetical protein